MPKAKFKKANVTSTVPSPEHYMYPKSTTLKNKYGITNLEAFTAKCAHDSAKAMINLREAPLPEKFDSSYLCSIHQCLFENTFEWAGQTRNVPFTFLDSSVAVMPKMKRAEWNSVFANDDEIEKGLQTLNKTLAEKNDLRSLTREDFILEAVPLFVSLKNIRPFIDGNEHTIHFFFEKLAQAAGHQLNFSLVTKERMLVASVAAIQNDNLEPMQHLFEDISNPEKICLLQEFMDNMKNLGRNINDRPVMVTKEGETYTGTYRGAGLNSFAFNVKGAYIIGNKEHLTPEQLKTLKPGDRFTFTAPKTQELEQTLIPKETLAPLTKDEKAELIAEDARVHTTRDQIQKLSKTVYGNEKTLDKQMVAIIKNPALGQQLAEQIEKAPNSVAHLAGFSLCGLQNQARANAKNHLEMLCSAVANFAHAVKHAEKEITQEHATEQSRRAKTVEMPSKGLQDLFTLPKELQQEALAKNPELQKELNNLVKNINSRLSATEHKAVKNNAYETLAQSMGISENKAQKIAQTVKQAKEVHQQAYAHTINRSNVLAMAS
ncbi:BID domain-containing T4SS effector [Bartonella tribocorum]|uniref:protein adenylyltransferase n=1 Tax=Bartonella tribocorum TaxID=85701 RepID=A0A2M6US40_9HYPH|nr:BID domain-containing T4SS effector [Bartonella tribocorum]PIT69010.1 adenosine monophosphate-protein transferase [Bartonella tribocorum]